jgi:V8-like Glu-specific endopeptidase
VVRYRWYKDEQRRAALIQRYGPFDGNDVASSGPDFISPWPPADADEQLQGFLRSAQEMDVGFLELATRRSRSICRIEIPGPLGMCYGTGFLVAANLVLTNHHVVAYPNPDDIQANAQTATLRFNYVTGENGAPENGLELQLHSTKPILAYSPTDDLDYALLQVEESIRDYTNLTVTPYALTLPIRGRGLHILHHPEGNAMKLGFSDNGINGVFDRINRIQYVTQARGGSSGAPCFNDQWQVIAIHRSERSRPFGSIREGVLFRAIYPEIQHHLT